MEEFVTIGVVTSPFGCRGEVKVLPCTDFPERFAALERVFLEVGGSRTPKRVERARRHKKFVLLKLEGVATPEEAGALRGAAVQVPRPEVWPLPPGRYYIFQLLGLPVYTDAGEFVGRLKDVLQTGANDVYVVAAPGGKEYLVPAVREVVQEIDVSGGRIVIRPLPGLLEE